MLIRYFYLLFVLSYIPVSCQEKLIDKPEGFEIVIKNIDKKDGLIKTIEIIMNIKSLNSVEKIEDIHDIYIFFSSSENGNFITSGQQFFRPVEKNFNFDSNKTKLLSYKLKDKSYLELKFDIYNLAFSEIEEIISYFHIRDTNRSPVLMENTNDFIYKLNSTEDQCTVQQCPKHADIWRMILSTGLSAESAVKKANTISPNEQHNYDSFVAIKTTKQEDKLIKNKV